jgi:hypothetical protein
VTFVVGTACPSRYEHIFQSTLQLAYRGRGGGRRRVRGSALTIDHLQLRVDWDLGQIDHQPLRMSSTSSGGLGKGVSFGDRDLVDVVCLVEAGPGALPSGVLAKEDFVRLWHPTKRQDRWILVGRLRKRSKREDRRAYQIGASCAKGSVSISARRVRDGEGPRMERKSGW